MQHQTNSTDNLTLVLTANGKTGRRVCSQLEERGVPIRRGSRSASIPFDWDKPETWARALAGVHSAYVVYTPDLAVPGAPGAIRAFTRLAADCGVQHLVLLSGRGEEEAQACEDIVRESGLEWTVIRSSWFCQNFSEGDFREMVLSGVVALPAGEITEPFIDVDDIADVAVAALTGACPSRQVYEVTGPRSIDFREAIQTIAAASGHEVKYFPISHAEFAAGLDEAGFPKPLADLLKYLLGTVLDGRNSYVANGVQEALGRAPRDFRDFAAKAAGSWQTQAQGA